MRVLLVLFALILSPILALPATAQESNDPHEEFVQAIQGNVSVDDILTAVLAETARQFHNEPTFAMLEYESPGTINAVVKAMAPALRVHQVRVREKFFPEYVALARDIFTDEEASELADFYNSDIGLRLLQSVSQNFSVSNMLEDVTEQGKDVSVTEDQIQRDRDLTVARSMQALSPEEIQEIGARLIVLEGFSDLTTFRDRSVAIQLRLENEPPTAAEEKMIEEAIGRVLAERFPE